MKISVIGCGYLGAVHATCMASIGHHVVGLDSDRERAALLDRGVPTVYEPGLDALLADTLQSGRLRFTDDPEALADATVHFLCVGTPQQADSDSADLSSLYAASRTLLPLLKPGDLVVGKSTVPVGTAQSIATMISEVEPAATLIWNPEFLREGFAVDDTLHPDRLVYGVASADDDHREWAVARLDQVYATALADRTPRLVTDLQTAELVKVAANSFLATKISFINAMAEVCEATGADVTVLADAIGHDARIGRKFLNSGLGFGGGCLPKDIRGFIARSEELGIGEAVSFLRDVDRINSRRLDAMVALTREAVGGSLAGRRITALGAAFKPNSDDVRSAPALQVAALLQAEGAHVVVTDPHAVDNARKARPDLHHFSDDLAEALDDSDAVVLLTEWPQYRELDPVWAGRLVKQRTIIDGRNVLDPDAWRQAGWQIAALGRPALIR